MSDNELIECPYCGARQDSWAAFCSECSEPLALTPAWQRRLGGVSDPISFGLEAIASRSDDKRLYPWWAVIGTLGIVIGDFLVGYLAYDSPGGVGDTWFDSFCCSAIPVILVLGTILGIAIGAPIYRTLRQKVSHYAALGLTSVCIGIITALLSFAFITMRLRDIRARGPFRWYP